ncbi:MAG: FKBP-type peptidyl-prolyl cis-trans isomerase [Coriobacteriales bacterium]|jgi:foldase protein PrsA|nr:FKBP-type peptidyl-prolyl cis-trans isomerase [Coriobacteriales bacterium]
MKFFKAIGAALCAVILAVSLVACKGGNDAASSGSIAATIGGVDVLESDVTARIETYRIDQTTGEKMGDVAWAKLLNGAGFTPESLREYVIKQQFAMPILILQEAEAAGIAPETTAVDDQITQQKENLGEDGEGWTNYLTQMGYANEEAYRQWLEAQNVTTALLEAKVSDAAPTQEEIDEYITANAAMYAGKRSSAIYFAIDDTNTLETVRPGAEEVLARINDGEDFAALASEYTEDAAAKEKAGDMGWSVFASVPQQYLEALNSLSVGETSGLVETETGIYLIKCTDSFAAGEDGTVELASVPADIVEMLTESLTQTNLSTKQQAYFDGLLTSDKVVINPMPEGLPYAVDMELANEPDVPAEGAEGTEGAGDEGTGTEGSADQPQSTGELVISDTTVGTGDAAQIGDTVSVHYTGYLDDGTVFDSSYDRGEPFQLTIGAGTVIQGWEQGIPGMQVGGKRQLIIPPNLAYGESGQGSIPPNATLTFDVELVSIDATAQ